MDSTASSWNIAVRIRYVRPYRTTLAEQLDLPDHRQLDAGCGEPQSNCRSVWCWTLGRLAPPSFRHPKNLKRDGLSTTQVLAAEPTEFVLASKRSKLSSGTTILRFEVTLLVPESLSLPIFNVRLCNTSFYRAGSFIAPHTLRPGDPQIK